MHGNIQSILIIDKEIKGYTTCFTENEVIRPLSCRWAVTFEASKVTKNACQQKGFFAARGLALQIRQNQGCKMLPYFVRSYLELLQLLLCPFHPVGHHCFA